MNPKQFLADGRFASDPWFLVALGLALPSVVMFAISHRLGMRAQVPSGLLMFVLVYPLLEEAAFRGLLQSMLLRSASLARAHALSLTGANLVTSLAFALAHALREPWLWAAATLLPSLLFGVARERYGSVLPPTVLHVAYNGAMALGLWWAC